MIFIIGASYGRSYDLAISINININASETIKGA